MMENYIIRFKWKEGGQEKEKIWKFQYDFSPPKEKQKKRPVSKLIKAIRSVTESKSDPTELSIMRERDREKTMLASHYLYPTPRKLYEKDHVWDYSLLTSELIHLAHLINRRTGVPNYNWEHLTPSQKEINEKYRKKIEEAFQNWGKKRKALHNMTVKEIYTIPGDPHKVGYEIEGDFVLADIESDTLRDLHTERLDKIINRKVLSTFKKEMHEYVRGISRSLNEDIYGEIESSGYFGNSDIQEWNYWRVGGLRLLIPLWERYKKGEINRSQFKEKWKADKERRWKIIGQWESPKGRSRHLPFEGRLLNSLPNRFIDLMSIAHPDFPKFIHAYLELLPEAKNKSLLDTLASFQFLVAQREDYESDMNQRLSFALRRMYEGEYKRKGLNYYRERKFPIGKVSFEGYRPPDNWELSSYGYKEWEIDEDGNLVLLPLEDRYPEGHYTDIEAISKSLPEWGNEKVDHLVFGYKVMGTGLYTVALYHPNFDNLILFSQDVAKMILTHLHHRFREEESSFPKLEALAKTFYSPLEISKEPQAWEMRYRNKQYTNLTKKPIYIYTVPEYSLVLFNPKTHTWYVVYNSPIHTERNFWEKIKESDVRELDWNSFAAADLNLLLKFLQLKMKDVIERQNNKYASAKLLESDEGLLEKVVYEMASESVPVGLDYIHEFKEDIMIMISAFLNFERSMDKKYSFGWDYNLSERWKPKDKEWINDLMLFRNVFVSEKEGRVILLDLVIKGGGVIPLNSGVEYPEPIQK